MSAATGVHAIELGQLDDFDQGAMMCATDGWEEGGASPNPPFAEAGCGVSGSCCLRVQSSGGFGPGSRQVVYNETQWSGDYIAAGVDTIQMQVANASIDETIYLRVGVTNGVTCYVSTDAVVLPPAMPGPGGLVPASFSLDSSTMTEVLGNNCGVGGDSLDTVLGGVIQLRLLSSISPSWLGDPIVSEIQVDAIESVGGADFDGDGVGDDVDNCTEVSNADQIDADADGYGNVCDQDLNNDCLVNAIDLGLLRSVFFTADPVADFNSDGAVNATDLGFMRISFFGQPGPGTGSCAN